MVSFWNPSGLKETDAKEKGPQTLPFRKPSSYRSGLRIAFPGIFVKHFWHRFGERISFAF